MNVAELIASFKDVPHDLRVVSYNNASEEHGYPSRVAIVESEEDELYDKGFKPSELGAEFPYVRIW